MLDFGFERSLLLCLLLNAAVFFSAWFFASRRWTTSRSQAVLDAALLGYAVQYAAVGLAGMLGMLHFAAVNGIALAISVSFLAWGWRRQTAIEVPVLPLRDRLTVAGVGLFILGFVLAYAHEQEYLPVFSNDAMTYHFPAAVQWIQQGKIAYFPTWFFNPANTYSPLAGSTFIAWLLLPFGNDLLARFVEVPALLCVGMAIYRLGRQIGARPLVAVLMGWAAILSRPFFTACMMSKDDLFVVFFFSAALVAMSHVRSGEPFGWMRFGIALGLLAATKYTALLAVPVLMLLIDGPRWKLRGWCFAVTTAAVLAGPWYLHNWVSTGNPIFPVAVPHVFRGLFTTTVSRAFHPWQSAISVVVGGQYGLPMPLAIALAISWLACVVSVLVSLMNGEKSNRDPLLRGILGGPILGLGLFYFSSPFPEVRFVLPMFALLFVSGAIAIERCCRRWNFAAVAVATLVFLISLVTVFSERRLTGQFAMTGLLVSVIGVLGYYLTRRAMAVIGAGILVVVYFAFIYWRAYCVDYLTTQHVARSAYDRVYHEPNQLWRWVSENVPADATVAYSNLYLVYPLQGPALRRHMVYAATRPGIAGLSDLPWLGDHLPGEAIVPAACDATVCFADRSTWIENLRRLRCSYLVIGHGGATEIPPEAHFAASLPGIFDKTFDSSAGTIYRINRDKLNQTTVKPDRN